MDVKANVRLISATNKDVKALVDSNAFRHDLYRRIEKWAVHIPPLKTVSRAFCFVKKKCEWY